MSDVPTGDPEAARYEIRIKGHLELRWGAWFDGLTAPRSSTARSPIRPRCTASCGGSATWDWR